MIDHTKAAPQELAGLHTSAPLSSGKCEPAGAAPIQDEPGLGERLRAMGFAEVPSAAPNNAVGHDTQSLPDSKEPWRGPYVQPNSSGKLADPSAAPDTLPDGAGSDGEKMYMELGCSCIECILRADAKCDPPFDVMLRLESIIRERDALRARCEELVEELDLMTRSNRCHAEDSLKHLHRVEQAERDLDLMKAAVRDADDSLWTSSWGHELKRGWRNQHAVAIAKAKESK